MVLELKNTFWVVGVLFCGVACRNFESKEASEAQMANANYDAPAVKLLQKSSVAINMREKSQKLTKSTYGRCSGVVISEQRIATAAHCIDMAEDAIRVDIFVNGLSYEGVKFRKHPTIDVGTMHLKYPIKNFKEESLGVPLMQEGQSVTPKDHFVAVGYGRADCAPGGQKKHNLKYSWGEFELLQWLATYNAQGQSYSNGLKFMSKDALKMTAACPGDSGGPVFVRKSIGSPFKLVGINSAGTADPTNVVPSLVAADIRPIWRWLFQ